MSRLRGVRWKPSAWALVATVASATAAAGDPYAVPTPSPAALAYRVLSDRYWLAAQLLTLAILALVLASGLGAVAYATLLRWMRGAQHAATASFAASYFLLAHAARAPLELAWQRAYEHAHRVPLSEAVPWLAGYFRGGAPAIAGFTLAAVVGYALIARSPRNWWRWAAVLSALVALSVLLLQPFMLPDRPLGDSLAEREIVAFARRAGVPENAIRLQDVCETCCPAATVVGLGPTRRIVLDDTLLTTHTAPELRQVVAHESSHYVGDDNRTAFLLIAGMALGGFWLVDRLGRATATRFGARLGFTELANPASLAFVVFILSTAFFVTTPFTTWFQRELIERPADRFALTLTHDNRSEAQLYRRYLACDPLVVPEPGAFYETFRDTHPSLAAREADARDFHPWRDSEPGARAE